MNCREIGLRREMREQVSRQTKELIRSNADLEEFAYAVAHDLREPLRTMPCFQSWKCVERSLDTARVGACATSVLSLRFVPVLHAFF